MYKSFSEKDPKKRNKILKKIDIASVKAAEFVVFNEFDTLYKNLGADMVNAHTWYDETVYKVRMPKNQLATWACRCRAI
ncbi:MAG: hypothetical protein H6625_05990 [Bdellovibrionaceae bacterium]|nr:hypothetical protein [Pseudobdellovibrionaceae bacterium]